MIGRELLGNHWLLEALVGLGIAFGAGFIMSIFAIYQICSDLAANPVPGGWNVAATLTTFVGTYLTTSWGWREP